VTDPVMHSESSGVVPDVRALRALPGPGLGQVGVELGPKVGVGEVGEEIAVSGEGLVAKFAVGFHFFVEAVLWQVLQQIEDHFVAHAEMKGHVEPILLGDVTTFRRTLEWGHLRDAGEKLLLEMNLGQVAEVFGHPLRLDGADLAVVGRRIVARRKRLVQAGLQRTDAQVDGLVTKLYSFSASSLTPGKIS